LKDFPHHLLPRKESPKLPHPTPSSLLLLLSREEQADYCIKEEPLFLTLCKDKQVVKGKLTLV